MDTNTLSQEALTAAIEKAGGVTRLADMLGVGQSVVSNWRPRGVPAERCPAIEAITGVRCEQLRPDLNWTRDKSGNVTGHHVSVAA